MHAQSTRAMLTIHVLTVCPKCVCLSAWWVTTNMLERVWEIRQSVSSLTGRASEVYECQCSHHQSIPTFASEIECDGSDVETVLEFVSIFQMSLSNKRSSAKKWYVVQLGHRCVWLLRVRANSHTPSTTFLCKATTALALCCMCLFGKQNFELSPLNDVIIKKRWAVPVFVNTVEITQHASC